MKRIVIFFLGCVVGLTQAFGSDPMATTYTFAECEGSLTPYPVDKVKEYAYPDSLAPVFINYVGRHGSRYPASATYCNGLRSLLHKADSLKTITPLGRKLMVLTDEVIKASEDRWGALDNLGEAEQRGIATRLYYNFGEVFSGGDARVKGMSSYSPRAMMSMYAFVHQLDRMNNKIEFETTSGRQNNLLLRPFDEDKDYKQYRSEGSWREPYTTYFKAMAPASAIRKVVGEGYPFESEEEAQEASLTEYYVLAGLSAMGLPNRMGEFLSVGEANALWSCFNLRQYLQWTATTVSTVAEEMASDLVLNIIETTDNYVEGNDRRTCAILRFGHAETMMPLLSLLRIPGCRYLTNYFDTVAKSWKDFEIVPMSANLQLIVFRSEVSGRYYVRIDLNETPVKLRQGDDTEIYPWGEVRRYMTNCVPIYRNF